MRTKALAVIALAIATAFGCRSGSASAEYTKFKSPDDVPRITVEDAKREADAGTAVIVDSRSEDAFQVEHIAGAINVPIGSSEDKLRSLPSDKKVIVYCSCGTEGTSMRLAFQLNQMGYPRTFALHGGTVAWHNAGYPMERSN